jgi:nucleotide-binding universal stress UspA family protein
MPFRKILVPTDFSPHSAEALRVAIDLSKSFDAAVQILAVYQPPIVPLVPEGAIFPLPVDVAADVARVNTKLLELAKQAEQAGAKKVTTALRQGVPFAEIIAEAREGEFDLITMGTHGRTGLRHALLGSVAEKVVRKAPCAVLSVRLSGHTFEHP